MHGISSNGDVLLVGVQVNGFPTGWGECVGLLDDPSISYNLGAATSTIHKIVKPALQERPFTNIRDLYQRLETLLEPVTYLDTIEAPPQQTGVSRRSIITGIFQESDPETRKIQERLGERPLPPNLQFGICQAILNAFAYARNQTPAKLLKANYELSPAKKSLGLHVEVTDDNMAKVDSVLKLQVKSLGYTIRTNKPQKTLGDKGDKLENLVKQLTAWIATKSVDLNLAIHLNVNGAMTGIFGTNIGHILRLFNALEEGGAPYQVRVENLSKETEQEKPTMIYRQLQSFLSYKEKPVQLWVGYPYYSLNAIELFIDSGKIDGLHLDVTQMGNLNGVMTIIANCQEKDIPVMVSGGNDARGVETAVSVAIATGADLITGPPDLVYNALQQSKFG